MRVMKQKQKIGKTCIYDVSEKQRAHIVEALEMKQRILHYPILNEEDKVAVAEIEAMIMILE